MRRSISGDMIRGSRSQCPQEKILLCGDTKAIRCRGWTCAPAAPRTQNREYRPPHASSALAPPAPPAGACPVRLTPAHCVRGRALWVAHRGGPDQRCRGIRAAGPRHAGVTHSAQAVRAALQGRLHVGAGATRSGPQETALMLGSAMCRKLSAHVIVVVVSKGWRTHSSFDAHRQLLK